jgi:dynein heavy chain
VTYLEGQLPIIEVLCSHDIRKRHWSSIQSQINSPVKQEDMTLQQFKVLKLHEHLEQLTEISEMARREARLEAMLDKMEKDWTTQYLELSTFRDTKTPILESSNVEAMQMRLDEHMQISQTVRSSPDVAPLQDRVEQWEAKLVSLQEMLEIWLRV